MERGINNKFYTFYNFKCGQFTNIETCVQNTLNTIRQHEANGQLELISCNFNSYEPFYAGKRGKTLFDSKTNANSVSGFITMLAINTVANAKEITQVSLFYKKKRSPQYLAEIHAKIFYSHGMETAGMMEERMLNFIEALGDHHNVVSISIDSYMPTSVSGSRNEHSFGVVFYRQTT